MKTDWPHISLGELTAHRPICYGVLKPGERQEQGVPLIRITDITADDLDESDIYQITPALSREFRRSVLEGGEVLLSIQGTIGRVAICPQHLKGANISRTLALIAPDKRLNRSFLRYWLLSLHGEFPTCGSTRASLNIGALRELKAPTPPLPEQHRIAGILDEAFEGIATAKVAAEKNLQNARALFESHLQSVFTQQGKGWVEKTLGEACEMYQPKTIGTKDLVPDGPYSVFGANGIIGRYDKFNHEEPQLLVTCRGATCGAVNISEPKSWITGNAMVVRPRDESLDAGFLEYVFRGGIDISKAITGAAQPQITRTNLSPLLICFPKSQIEQQRFASTFRELAAKTQRIERIYEQKLAELEALKKSILHQAFTGQL